MLVPAIFTFTFHRRMVIEGPLSRLFLTFTVIVSLLGVAFALRESFSRFSSGMAVALCSPLFHSFALRKMNRRFIQTHGRPPEDVAFNWAPGLERDRAFAMIFVLGAIFSSMIPIGFFHWGIALE